MHAVRNISLCTKDCVCLFVCPSGATDTETGQIDSSKCIDGCRLCVDACPSHAIYLVYDNFAKQQEKSANVIKSLFTVASSKSKQEAISASLAANAKTVPEKRLARALELSFRIQAEDSLREAGFMLPQSDSVRSFLKKALAGEKSEGFPTEAAERLLELL